MTAVTESIVEDATLDWFQELGYARTNGLLIAPGEPATERGTFADVVLVERERGQARNIFKVPAQRAVSAVFAWKAIKGAVVAFPNTVIAKGKHWCAFQTEMPWKRPPINDFSGLCLAVVKPCI